MYFILGFSNLKLLKKNYRTKVIDSKRVRQIVSLEQLKLLLIIIQLT